MKGRGWNAGMRFLSRPRRGADLPIQDLEVPPVIWMTALPSVFGLLLMLAVAPRAEADVSYGLKVVTFYQFGAPGDLVAGPGGQPDTSFARFINVGPSTLSGTFMLSGVSASGQSWQTSVVRTVGPGATMGSLSLTHESSNFGGFNKIPGSVDQGIRLTFAGTATIGSSVQTISLSVYDRDVHSGVPRNPFGDYATDAYVLQGGDAYGRDTGDDFEVSQAAGTHVWQAVDSDGDGVLDPVDNCPQQSNAPQSDCDADGTGDACEGVPDCDMNGIPDDCDLSGGGALDVNSNGVPDRCECPPDVDESGAVNGVDLVAILSNWGTSGGKYPRADVNADGVVDSTDLAFVLYAWGPCE